MIIGDDVVVTVLEVRGDVVRIGIDAPRHVQVHREEIYRELQAANAAAAVAVSDEAVSGIASLLAPGRGRADRVAAGEPGDSQVPGPPAP